jgi:molecular chaperone GrpE
MPEKKSAKIKVAPDERSVSEEEIKENGATGPSAEPEDAIAELQEQLQGKAAELKETHDRLLRVSAEFDNYKKRSARESSEFRKYANQALLKDLLPVVDNLDLAINSTGGQSEIEKSLLEGLEITRKEILKVLEKYHVTPIEAVGRPFDPEYHEAAMRQESDEHAENTVISEFQKGYLIHDRLLRPAMVVVASPKASDR